LNTETINPRRLLLLLSV